MKDNRKVIKLSKNVTVPLTFDIFSFLFRLKTAIKKLKQKNLPNRYQVDQGQARGRFTNTVVMNSFQSSNGLGVMAVKSSSKKYPKIGVQDFFFKCPLCHQL